MENPFETYAETISAMMRKRHVCKTYMAYEDQHVRADGEVEPWAKKSEFWVNNECATDACEYCSGWKYNEWFQEKPTESDIRELLMKHAIRCDMAKKVKRKKYNAILHNGEENNGQLITLAIDKEYKQMPKLCEDIINEVRKSNYACLHNAEAVCEFYGTDGDWNPHIHVVTKKVENAGKIAQLFRRKFIKPKWQVYRVHIKEEPYEAARKYVHHDKIEEKTEAMKKDKEYRSTHSLSDIYEI